MPKRRWPTEDELNRCLTLAAEWIARNRLAGTSAWPVSAGVDEPSVWGGTVDAVLALEALRDLGGEVADSVGNPHLERTQAWLRDRQNDDGSFPSTEFAYSGAEPTAWALIALHKTTNGRSDEVVEKALRFLETCVDRRDGSVSSTPSHFELPRTMPTAVALWAFSLWDHQPVLRGKMVTYLLRCQDNDSHGWGVTSSARPNPATTGQVIVALRAASVPPQRFRLATEYLVKRQRVTGRWPSSIDEWHTPPDQDALQPVHKCLNSGSVWCLLALSRSHDHRARAACLRAVRYLLDSQTTTGSGSDEGSWLTSDDGSQRHVWLTAQIVVAIAAWQSGLPRIGLRRDGMRLVNSVLALVDLVLARATQIALFGVVLAVIALNLGPTEANLFERVVGDWAAFRQGLLTSGLSTAIIGAISWGVRGVRNWRARLRQG